MAGIRKTRTVYIISSMLTPKVYIGSTSRTLAKRFERHNCMKELCTSKVIIGYGGAKISPLCVVENCTKQEIELKEQDYIFCFKDICVNIRGTKDRYSKDYKRPCLLDGRYKAWQNTKNICCVCGGKYTNVNKTQHLKSPKHLAKI